MGPSYVYHDDLYTVRRHFVVNGGPGVMRNVFNNLGTLADFD